MTNRKLYREALADASLDICIVEQQGDVTNSRVSKQALFHSELDGVDPSDPNLSQDTKDKIFKEVLVNPWYFFQIAGNKNVHCN